MRSRYTNARRLAGLRRVSNASGARVAVGRFGAVYQSVAAIPIVFYGYAFHRVSTSLFQVPFAAVDKGHIVPSFGIFVGLFASLVALAVLLLGSEKVRRIALPVGAISQLAAGLLVALVYYQVVDDPVVALVGGVLGSFATTLLSALWIDLYARLNPVRAVWCGAVALLISQALVFLVEGNALYRVFVVLACAPLLSLACFLAAVRSGKGGSSRPGKRGRAEGGKPQGANPPALLRRTGSCCPTKPSRSSPPILSPMDSSGWAMIC